MSADFRVRANPMKIHSIEDFFMVRGGMRGGVKDVYFVRAIGCAQNTCDVVKRLEEAHKTDYLRLNDIAKFMSSDESAFYAEQYDKFKKSGNLSLKNGALTERSLNILADASNDARREFKKLRPDANDSVVKNFLVMLWHRVDNLFGALKQRDIAYDPGKTLKISAQKITSVKDYLFFYALTRLGFDILILNSSADIDEKLNSASLSDSFKAGDFGELKLPEFSYEAEKPAVHKMSKQKAKAKSSAASEQVKAPTQPKTQSVKHQAAKEESAVKKSPRKRKKSFEQLASLASSVVMLTAVNSKGEIVSSGSGIVIGTDGLTLTNHHVIEDSDAFAVRTENDDSVYWMTEIIKVNAAWDLALIRINKNLKPLKLCTEPLKLVRGQEVVAIGSPLGFFNSVSDGIISGFRGGDDAKYIQFTAPISPGSSGGALLNMYGEIIGITSGHIGKSQNINLAVSCENIRAFADSFLK